MSALVSGYEVFIGKGCLCVHFASDEASPLPGALALQAIPIHDAKDFFQLALWPSGNSFSPQPIPYMRIRQGPENT